jgi:ABC-2 type transport system ATP-binding protein
MVEAEALSHRVAIIDHGKISALDSPHGLKKLVSTGDAKIFTMRIPNLTPHLVDSIRSLGCVAGMDQADAYDLKISTRGADAIETIVEMVKKEGGSIDSINTYEPSLEDVFLTVTGKEMRDKASDSNATPMYHDHGEAPKARAR